MNAYELADQVEMWGEDLLALNMKGGIPVVEGAKMLRQQADRIAELEKENNRLQDHMTELRKIHTERIEAMEKTHPVKQLSDEEILDRTKMWFNIHPDTELKEKFEIKLYDLNQFARAIIKEITE